MMITAFIFGCVVFYGFGMGVTFALYRPVTEDAMDAGVATLVWPITLPCRLAVIATQRPKLPTARTIDRDQS